MKKAQIMLEYLLFLLVVTVICVLITMLWNRSAIIRGSTFGVEDENNTVHVRPFVE